KDKLALNQSSAAACPPHRTLARKASSCPTPLCASLASANDCPRRAASFGALSLLIIAILTSAVCGLDIVRFVSSNGAPYPFPCLPIPLRSNVRHTCVC